MFPKLKKLNITNDDDNYNDFKNETEKMYTEIYNRDINLKYDKLRREAIKNTKMKRKKKKINFKNYFKKNDFIYFG